MTFTPARPTAPGSTPSSSCSSPRTSGARSPPVRQQRDHRRHPGEGRRHVRRHRLRYLPMFDGADCSILIAGGTDAGKTSRQHAVGLRAKKSASSPRTRPSSAEASTWMASTRPRSNLEGRGEPLLADHWSKRPRTPPSGSRATPRRSATRVRWPRTRPMAPGPASSAPARSSRSVTCAPPPTRARPSSATSRRRGTASTSSSSGPKRSKRRQAPHRRGRGLRARPARAPGHGARAPRRRMTSDGTILGLNSRMTTARRSRGAPTPARRRARAREIAARAYDGLVAALAPVLERAAEGTEVFSTRST